VAPAFASCQHWASGYYPSYRHMADEDLDLVPHLGDYLYEDGIPAARNRLTDAWSRHGPMIKFNPHIRFFDGDRRGYMRCRVDRARMRVDLRTVSTVSTPGAPEATSASFAVESGRPGAVRV
jgi:phosphodiesterase/alkaline phosphatase D-like protein